MSTKTYSEAFEDRANKLIDEAIEKYKDDLSAGNATLEVYKHITGRIAGLREAKEHLDKAIKDFMQQ